MARASGGRPTESAVHVHVRDVSPALTYMPKVNPALTVPVAGTVISVSCLPSVSCSAVRV